LFQPFYHHSTSLILSPIFYNLQKYVIDRLKQNNVKNFPSIFNDVIGPVMRGPSSSHTAASWRIARCAMDILNEPLKKAVISFDRDGAWAPNYREQGTTIGIEGGLLELDMTDDRMKYTEKIAGERGIDISYEINSFPTNHVNTVRLQLEGESGKKSEILAASLGGGSFEIQRIDDFNLRIRGDYYELLLSFKDQDPNVEDIKSVLPPFHSMALSSTSHETLVNFKFSKSIPRWSIQKLRDNVLVEDIRVVNPVLPIVLGNESDFPFESVDTLLKYAERENLDLAACGLLFEKCISGLNNSPLHEQMKSLIGIIENSIKVGLSGTDYHDRILPQQSHLINEASQRGKVLRNKLINDIIANVSAIMEAKSAMEVVVANPTAGSCGAVGGVIRAVADEMGASDEEVVKAYFAAGMIGVFFAMGPGFSAEEHGCQVECGASGGMAAAAIVQLYGGTARQAIDAASMAIQNMIGLICDPVADRVEVPCLGKNISAAMNALTAATMSCSGFNAVIPLDEVIQTVSKVSAQMPSCNKCTGRGGLAVTKTACRLKSELKSKEAVTTS
jgi:L-serine dehydratase